MPRAVCSADPALAVPVGADPLAAPAELELEGLRPPCRRSASSCRSKPRTRSRRKKRPCFCGRSVAASSNAVRKSPTHGSTPTRRGRRRRSATKRRTSAAATTLIAARSSVISSSPVSARCEAGTFASCASGPIQLRCGRASIVPHRRLSEHATSLVSRVSVLRRRRRAALTVSPAGFVLPFALCIVSSGPHRGRRAGLL